MKHDVESKLEELKLFVKDNEAIFKKYEKLKSDIDQLLFKKYCLKEYKTECDASFCIFFNTSECKYPREINKIKDL